MAGPNLLTSLLLLLSLISMAFTATDPNDLAILNQFRKNMENPDLLNWPSTGDDPCGPPKWDHVFPPKKTHVSSFSLSSPSPPPLKSPGGPTKASEDNPQHGVVFKLAPFLSPLRLLRPNPSQSRRNPLLFQLQIHVPRLPPYSLRPTLLSLPPASPLRTSSASTSSPPPSLSDNSSPSLAAPRSRLYLTATLSPSLLSRPTTSSRSTTSPSLRSSTTASWSSSESTGSST
ncbi:hypothetical protein ACLB2K_040913 [Fragaria x ananassa]